MEIFKLAENVIQIPKLIGKIGTGVSYVGKGVRKGKGVGKGVRKGVRKGVGGDVISTVKLKKNNNILKAGKGFDEAIDKLDKSFNEFNKAGMKTKINNQKYIKNRIQKFKKKNNNDLQYIDNWNQNLPQSRVTVIDDNRKIDEINNFMSENFLELDKESRKKILNMIAKYDLNLNNISELKKIEVTDINDFETKFTKIIIDSYKERLANNIDTLNMFKAIQKNPKKIKNLWRTKFLKKKRKNKKLKNPINEYGGDFQFVDYDVTIDGTKYNFKENDFIDLVTESGYTEVFQKLINKYTKAISTGKLNDRVLIDQGTNIVSGTRWTKKMISFRIQNYIFNIGKSQQLAGAFVGGIVISCLISWFISCQVPRINGKDPNACDTGVGRENSGGSYLISALTKKKLISVGQIHKIRKLMLKAFEINENKKLFSFYYKNFKIVSDILESNNKLDLIMPYFSKCIELIEKEKFILAFEQYIFICKQAYLICLNLGFNIEYIEKNYNNLNSCIYKLPEPNKLFIENKFKKLIENFTNDSGSSPGLSPSPGPSPGPSPSPSLSPSPISDSELDIFTEYIKNDLYYLMKNNTKENNQLLIDLLGFYPDVYQAPDKFVKILKINKSGYEEILKLRSVYKKLNPDEKKSFNELTVYEKDEFLNDLYIEQEMKKKYYILKNEPILLKKSNVRFIKLCDNNCNNQNHILLSEDLCNMYNFINNFERDEITDYELIEIYHPELLIKEQKTFFSKYKILIIISISIIFIIIFILIILKLKN